MSIPFFTKPWIRYLALGLIGLMISKVVEATGNQYVLDIALVLSAGCFIIAGFQGVQEWRRSREDPYSLNTLREYVLEGRIDDEDVPAAEENVDRLCPYCNEFYGPTFPVCPRCGR